MGRDNSNKVWIESDELFSLQSIKKEHKKLPVAVFLLCQDIVGNKFLQKLDNEVLTKPVTSVIMKRVIEDSRRII